MHNELLKYKNPYDPYNLDLDEIRIPHLDPDELGNFVILLPWVSQTLTLSLNLPNGSRAPAAPLLHQFESQRSSRSPSTSTALLPPSAPFIQRRESDTNRVPKSRIYLASMPNPEVS